MTGSNKNVDPKNIFALRKIALLGGVNEYVNVSSRELGDELGMSQQSASKRILVLLDAGYIVRNVGSRRQRIKITEAGIDALKMEYSEYRRIFEMTDHLVIKGSIATGMGQGSYYMCQLPYMDQFEDTVGFRPFEGTLNVKVDVEDIGKLDIIRSTSGRMIKGFTGEGRTFGNVIAYKARIKNINCAIVVPERSHYKETIEIVCQYHLRRTLGLEDGDRVEVRVEL